MSIADVYLDGDGMYAVPRTLATPGDVTEPAPADMGYLPAPAPADLARYLSWPELDQEQQEAAQAHLNRALAVVRSYTRRRGFLGDAMAPELHGVVLSLAGRSLSNPAGDARVVAGQWASSPGQPDFTLTDRLILDGWRRRAA